MRYDLEYVLGELGRLYDVHIQPNAVSCTSIMHLPKDTHWASTQSGEYFNRIVPRVKNMHMGMYAILEGVAKNEFKKNSVSAAFEWMDPLFTPFRHLNNQFKHSDIKDVPIELMQIVHLVGRESKSLDLMYRVNGENILYARFIVMFLTLLNKAGAISFQGQA